MFELVAHTFCAASPRSSEVTIRRPLREQDQTTRQNTAQMSSATVHVPVLDQLLSLLNIRTSQSDNQRLLHSRFGSGSNQAERDDIASHDATAHVRNAPNTAQNQQDDLLTRSIRIRPTALMRIPEDVDEHALDVRISIQQLQSLSPASTTCEHLSESNSDDKHGTAEVPPPLAFRSLLHRYQGN